eukprot:7135439-Lingulodinium_polyedra.AAC.1
MGLVLHDDGNVDPYWTVMVRVADSDKQERRDEKQSGPGRDERASPVPRDSGGKRATDLKEAMS